ncbi:putative uncharacterized protein [Waddlia chondrophila 2032/99]|uniref:Uncharacterized protein n=2 Tax=Waddlia chondrophila TaxID=71667 RepID=D6YW19_WADCW|nr:hypothetical protein [Waddlia chondrophila]ADI38330.1 hypothetical protein wcw_0970 [Waddlia chondrophila WSU 86-1044]CCB91412.1 putative uncharacterized protein [Waddlia chondrophila 2032/99]
MEESIEEKIKRLKSELAVAKQAHQLWDILIEKREKLEEKIAFLRAEIEDEKNAQYQQAQKAYEEIKNRGNKKEVLDTIKQSKQTIDEKLDEYEDFSDDIITYLQNQLVSNILKKHPGQESSYRNLDNQFHQSMDLKDKLQALSTLTRDIDTLINKIVEERKRAGPFRLLQFFLGVSPYYEISQNVQGIKLLCGKALNLLHDIEEKMQDNHQAIECFEQLLGIFVKLQSFAQQRWSYGKIDKRLMPLKGTLTPLADQMEMFKKEAEKNASSQEEMLNLWIDQHS